MMRRILLPLSSLLLGAGLSAAPLPGGFDHSGWYEFEVVVLVNADAEVLASETWPLLPQPGYPSRWRWLSDSAPSLKAISAREHSRIRQSLSGHIMINEPEPDPARWLPSDSILTEGDLALIDELIDLGMGSTPTDRQGPPPEDPIAALPLETLDTDPILPFEANAPDTPASPLLSLESLVADGGSDNVEPSVSVPFAPPELRAALAPIEVLAAPIPLPATFEKLPLTTLAPGLDRYRRNSNDSVVAATAWLQGPGSENLPIVIEPYSLNGYPQAQGFIQVLPRANSWRLGMNVWANTQGEYLPDIFRMEPPPPSPPRITRVTEPRAVASPIPSASGDPTQTSLNASKIAALDTDAVRAVGGDREPTAQEDGVNVNLGSYGVDVAPPPEWPWRHVIHIADTVPLTENRLRYYDHPVIKVLAIWRELSWYELYRRGATLRDHEQQQTHDAP
ncbi:MAG: hypothetical protein VW202_04455 [Halieaceae bacterium]